MDLFSPSGSSASEVLSDNCKFSTSLIASAYKGSSRHMVAQKTAVPTAHKQEFKNEAKRFFFF